MANTKWSKLKTCPIGRRNVELGKAGRLEIKVGKVGEPKSKVGKLGQLKSQVGKLGHSQSTNSAQTIPITCAMRSGLTDCLVSILLRRLRQNSDFENVFRAMRES